MANPFDRFDSPVAQTGKDVALSFGQGAAGLLKSVGDIYGLTTGDMDNVVSRKAQEAIESLQTQKSPEVLQMEEKRRQAVEAETGTLDKAWAYLTNTAPEFRLALGDIAQAAPSVLGTGGAGAAVRTGARMLGAGAKTAAKTGLGGAIATGAGLQAGEAGASQYAELVKTLGEMPDEQKAQIPQIADLMKRKGASLEDATTALLLDLSRDAGVFAALTSAASMAIPGGTSIERSLVGGAAKQPAKSLLSGVAKSAAGETGQEVLENVGAEIGKNIFARPVEPEREITRGVGEAMGASVLPALAMGGAAGAAQSISRPEPTPRPAPASQVAAGMSEETPAPAATKPSLAAEQQATLERSEDMTSEQFFATVNVRQARLLGGEPNPEDIKLVGDAPPPRVIIDPDMMRSAIDETQQALNDWRAKNPNAPENMVIVFDPEMLHNGFGIQGAFNQRDGSIFINAAFVAPENVGKIASHEWAHATLASPEGQRAFAEFAAREIPQEDLNALATRYGTQDRMVLLEEWIAENQEKAPGVISRIVARIREWLSGLGILDLSDAEVADIMLRSLREQAENKIQPDTQRVEGGIAPDQNLEVYETFIGNRLDAGPKMALQKLPTAADVTDAKGNLRYTIPKKTLDVSHYSFVPDLTEVDPAYYGTGRGEHYHRMMKGINKSFFFVGNSKPKAHENVAGKGMNRYRTTIDSSRIYDMDKDPLDLWFAPNPQKSEGLLKELGYDGFLAKTDDGRSFVALFYPTSLETGEVTRAVEPVEEAAAEDPQETAEEYLARVEREEAAERRKALRRASAGKYSLTQEPERISGIMASPSITDIQYDRAKRNLTSANQARFKSQITDYAPDADIFDAVGDWVDGAENSVAAIFRDRKPVNELQRLAAQAGLAGDQKAVLWWSTDPKGVDAIHEIVWPKGVSMDDARQAMIDVGLENRTLIQTPDGIRGFVFDQGRQNLNKIEALHEHETQPSLDSSPASGDFLGSWSSRAEGRRAYRRVLGSTPQTETGAGELRSEQVGTGSEPETRFSLAQTKTPEFKAWFGDSKVVDKDGKPLVVYHGTTDVEGIDIFRPGSHFGTVPQAERRIEYQRAGRSPSGIKAQILPVYLSLKNPKPVLDDGMPWGPKIAEAKRQGYDGLVYENVGELDENGRPFGGKSYVAFDPAQIKSATGNVGAFGQRAVTAEEAERVGMTEEEAAKAQAEGDLRFSLAQTKTPEFKTWFGDSQIVDADGNPQVLYHGTFNRRNFTGRNEDFTIFRPKSQNEGQPGVVFASPNPQLASEFTGVTPSYLERFSGDELGEKRPGARVYPVYVRAENPFDYENPSHVQRIFGDEDYIELVPGSEEGGPYGSVDYDGVSISRAKVEKGDWVDIEYLLGKIKDAGFDGAYVSEPDSTGKRTKNIAVFDPDQLKSATGNVGAFGQRPVTAEEAERMGLTEEEAAEEQRRGDIRFSLAQTKTPEFKKFFEGSKAVDSEGKPLRVYHGTMDGGFNVFLTGSGHSYGPGAYFSPDVKTAENYAGLRHVVDAARDNASREEIESELPKGRTPAIYSAYLSIKNPIDAYEFESLPGRTNGERNAEARRQGYDGVIKTWRNGEIVELVAFYPEQIKSATGNVGAFGQRPVTAEEAQRMGMTEEKAAEAQKRGDIRMSLTGKPVGEQALEDAKRLTFSNQKEVSKYLGELLRKEVPEGLDDESPEARRRLAELLDRELSLALTMPENADAIGWYSREMDKVFEILRSPELDYQLDDPINRGVFNAILAITSNGQKVVPQFLKTAQLYEGWRKTGKIPSVGKWGGERSRAIKNHVKFLNQMLEAVGPEQTVNFLTSEQSLGEHLNNLYGMVAEAQNLPEKATVANKKAAIRKYLNAKMPGGELVDYNAVGAIVFGPKLGGGFFANLYGKFDRLTMDRWFMRTFHRMTGRLGEDRPEMVQSILKEARMEAADVLPEDITDEEILNEITTTGKQAFKDYKEIKRRLKQDPNDTEAYGLDVMRRLYNRYLKAKSGLYDAPDNGSHRKFIREVLDEVQKLRAERGETKIETSDIQAILWYLEKDIWNRLRQSMDADAVAEADAQQDEDEGEDEDTAGRVSYSDGARELYRRKARREYGEGNEKPKERVLAGA